MFGGVADLVSPVGHSGVEVVADAASGEGGIEVGAADGVVGEDEGAVDGGALGLVDGGGLAVRQPLLGVGEGDAHGAELVDDGELLPLAVDPGDAAVVAVEDADGVVVA